MNTTTNRGARFKMFIPCISGRCPEMMQLKSYANGEPIYQCERRVGEKYSLDCYYHTNPYPAAEINQPRWVRDGKRWQPKKKDGERLAKEDLETRI